MLWVEVLFNCKTEKMLHYPVNGILHKWSKIQEGKEGVVVPWKPRKEEWPPSLDTVKRPWKIRNGELRDLPKLLRKFFRGALGMETKL